jgi:hypothetical protein
MIIGEYQNKNSNLSAFLNVSTTSNYLVNIDVNSMFQNKIVFDFNMINQFRSQAAAIILDKENFLPKYVRYLGKIISFSNQASFFAEYDGEHLEFTMEDLGVHIVSQSTDEAFDLLFDNLVFLWNSYVIEDPDVLSSSGKKLKESICQIITAID